jgi:hypothetical protein
MVGKQTTKDWGGKQMFEVFGRILGMRNDSQERAELVTKAPVSRVEEPFGNVDQEQKVIVWARLPQLLDLVLAGSHPGNADASQELDKRMATIAERWAKANTFSYCSMAAG